MNHEATTPHSPNDSVRTAVALVGNGGLSGFEGDDTLTGGDRADILMGGLGADILDGGDGFDLASYAQSSAGVVANLSNAAENTGEAAGDNYTLIEGFQGSAYADELTGSNLNNELNGNGGNDTLKGRGGADWLYGGAGYDFASYTDATYSVVANLSNARENAGDAAGDVYISIEALSGSAHNDTLTGNWDGNNLYGHNGDDRLVGLAGRDYLVGGAGNDMLIGGTEADWLVGGAGTDLAGYTTGVTASLLDASQNTGDAAGDTYESIEGLAGSNFADHLTGDHGNNTIYGHLGHDTIFGHFGNDRLYAGDDNDRLDGGSGADTLNGGEGFDYAEYRTAESGVVADLLYAGRNTGDAAGDVYVAIEGLAGSSFSDDRSGNDLGNEIYGLGGNDALEGRGGADWLYGGEGHDFATYYGATAGVEANLSESWRNQGEAAGDMYFSIEGLAGSAYADALGGNEHYNELFGHGGNDQLWGFGGGDWLVGGEGHDLLIGGAGSDWLTGGNGTDIFRFDGVLGAGNVDVVNDFGVGGPDLLQLTRNTFSAFANQGEVFGFQLAIGAAATTTAHRLVYNSGTGDLFYDADGAGGAAQVQFATLGKGLALSASSFALLWL
ncbi:hypothetical protein IC232_24155 [Microvirga sp. BT688]|uniref:calcium-binding protein n=1 Tax=Microvirga sp. TaxID=1873136 RepID=UPI0016836D62|nr:calcium-binding protein [Microvirga sp.]MBD2749776.1 hypothetical protein [Microvirga sp.]